MGEKKGRLPKGNKATGGGRKGIGGLERQKTGRRKVGHNEETGKEPKISTGRDSPRGQAGGEEGSPKTAAGGRGGGVK